MSGGDAGWLEELVAARRAKDEYFRTDPESPIPATGRAGFPGLSYFPPDPRWRFVGELTPPASPRIIDLTATHGAPRRYEVSGSFEFRSGATSVRLWAFRSDSPWLRDQYFLPFRDRTTGSETYRGGRYLDVDVPAAGTMVIDFNRAYQPYCAYNPTYSCPLPPSANQLPIAITAGERLPRSAPRSGASAGST